MRVDVNTDAADSREDFTGFIRLESFKPYIENFISSTQTYNHVKLVINKIVSYSTDNNYKPNTDENPRFTMVHSATSSETVVN
jgi:hypothetical protein